MVACTSTGAVRYSHLVMPATLGPLLAVPARHDAVLLPRRDAALAPTTTTAVLDVHLPGGRLPPRRPAWSFCVHGGFWRPAYDRPTPGRWRGRWPTSGCVVATPEYRRVGRRRRLADDRRRRAHGARAAAGAARRGIGVAHRPDLGDGALRRRTPGALAGRHRAPAWTACVALAPVADLRRGAAPRTWATARPPALLGGPARRGGRPDDAAGRRPPYDVRVVHGVGATSRCRCR